MPEIIPGLEKAWKALVRSVAKPLIDVEEVVDLTDAVVTGNQLTTNSPGAVTSEAMVDAGGGFRGVRIGPERNSLGGPRRSYRRPT